MATTWKQPTDRRGVAKLRASLDRLSRRERVAALALALLVVLLLAAGVGSAVGGGLPFGDDEEARGPAGVPSDWANLEPLLPLAPSLKDIAALKRTAAGEGSGVLAAESDGAGALRLRALPEGARTLRRARVAGEGAPAGRRRPAALRAPTDLRAPRIPLPSVRRILATRLGTALGAANELLEIVEIDLQNLPNLPIDLDLAIPRLPPLPDTPLPPIGDPVIDPPDLPGGNPLPGGDPLPGGGSLPGSPGAPPAPINVTVVNSQADSSFDVLLVARGRSLVEAYRFPDRDISGLAAQINLRSSVLVADVLRDRRRLARVTAAPLRSADASAPGAGTGTAGLAVSSASRGGGGGGNEAGQARPASATSGANERPSADLRQSVRSAGGSAAGRGSSPTRSSSPSSSSPRSGAANAPRRRARRAGRSGASPRTSPKPPRLRSSRGAGHSRGQRSQKPRKARKLKANKQDQKERKPKKGKRGQGGDDDEEGDDD